LAPGDIKTPLTQTNNVSVDTLNFKYVFAKLAVLLSNNDLGVAVT
jgi:hypothetical protein